MPNLSVKFNYTLHLNPTELRLVRLALAKRIDNPKDELDAITLLEKIEAQRRAFTNEAVKRIREDEPMRPVVETINRLVETDHEQ